MCRTGLFVREISSYKINVEREEIQDLIKFGVSFSIHHIFVIDRFTIE